VMGRHRCTKRMISRRRPDPGTGSPGRPEAPACACLLLPAPTCACLLLPARACACLRVPDARSADGRPGERQLHASPSSPAAPAAPASPVPARRPVPGGATTTMEHRSGWDVPVNNLLVRRRPARSARHRMLVSQRPGITGSRLTLTGRPRFRRHLHDREGSGTARSTRSFAIMKHLARCRARKPHRPRPAHSPRIPGAVAAGHFIVGLYPPYWGGEGPR